VGIMKRSDILHAAKSHNTNTVQPCTTHQHQTTCTEVQTQETMQLKTVRDNKYP